MLGICIYAVFEKYINSCDPIGLVSSWVSGINQGRFNYLYIINPWFSMTGNAGSVYLYIR